MFLITPNFSVRTQDIRKIIPHKTSKRTETTEDVKGTWVYVVNSHDGIDREFTTMSYEDVLTSLHNAIGTV